MSHNEQTPILGDDLGALDATADNLSVSDTDQLRSRAMTQCGHVLNWLGIVGKHSGMYFDGWLTNRSSGDLVPFEMEKINGAWECVNEGPYGFDIVSLVAYVFDVDIGEAAVRLKSLLGALERRTDIESVSEIGLNNQEVTAAITPVPSDMSAPPEEFGWLGEPSSVYSIRSATGELYGYTLRFDDFSAGDGPSFLGRPFYLPLTCWRSVDGAPKWRTRHLPGYVPLFGAEKLSSDRTAPVILTQDERSADYVGAGRLKNAGDLIGTGNFFSVGMVSSPETLEQTDLVPLGGRTVYIWPNSGDAGQAFADRIRTRLWAINPMTPVAVIAAVLHEPARSNSEGAFENDQVLDVDTEDFSPVHLASWCQEHRSRLELVIPRPGGKHPDRQFSDFTVNRDGVFVERFKDGEPYQVRLASRIDITALARNDDSDEWGVCAEFLDPDGVRHVWCLPRGLLGGDSATFCKPLLTMGATVSTFKTDKDDLGRYFMTGDPGTRARSVSQPGWCQRQFVFPDGTVLGPSQERVVFQTADPTSGNIYKLRGTLAEWKQNVAALCAGNSRLVIALCTAFVGPTLNLLGEENGGLHLRGESSSGKTTTLYVAASAWGPPRLGIKLWRATANGLESTAVQHNDGLLILDEMSQVGSTEVGQVAYMLANGQGKVRASQTGGARPSTSWRLMFLSTGEVGLKEHIESGGGRVMAGQETRLIDINANPGAGLGIFENLHGSQGGSEFSLLLKTRSAESYGTAGRAWVTALADPTQQAGIVAGLRRAIDTFVNTVVPAGADGQVARVGRRFGMIAAVGEACTGLGILPWSVGEATGAAQKCFTGWIENRGGIGNLEADQALMQVRRFIEVYGESRFTELGLCEDDVSLDHRMTVNRAGFRKLAGDGHTDFYILPEAYRSEVCAGLNPKQVTAKLVAAGALVLGSDSKPQVTKRLPGLGVVKVYHVRSTIINQG